MFFDWAPDEQISRLPAFLRPPALLWRNLRNFRRNWRRWRRQWHSLNAQEIRKHLTLSVQYVCDAHVCGEIAEFGTMTGKTATDLARAASEFHDSKKLLLFDSFAGLPEATSPIDQEAPHVQTGIWSSGACRGVTKERLLKMCRNYLPESRIAIFDGWFAQTLPTLAPGTQLALLHVDCDFYQSTRDVLNHCFSQGLVSPGAVVLFDDWNCNRADPRYGERRAWSEAVARFSIDYSEAGQYGWGANKVIVHAYNREGPDD